MELKDLRYFTEVANYGSFTKAAANTYISQPTLSKSIKKLESELKVELFERSTRKLMLTDAGEIVYKQAIKILGATDELSTLLDDLMNLPTGDIKIGIPPLIGTLFFPTIAKNFGILYPEVSLELIELGAKRIEHLVDQGEVDIGIIVLPSDKTKFNTLPFIKEQFMLYTYKEHILAEKKAVELLQLAEENFILFNREFALHELIINHCQKAGFYPNIVYESSQWDLITELVRSELGITLLPKSIFAKMDQNAIKMIPLSSPPMWELGIITKKDRYQSFAVRSLLQFITEEFSGTKEQAP
ncbi:MULTISPECIES: LysR family transcriptional regulator [Metabacillus]|uniref:LysR family transcriptional regulator n=2 Tax=Metabacillus TaxID=2675233 RepID=A0A179TA17_9BACI|nr:MULTISPECIES: LysR family transcriptional regulator [Metabacillus]OAS89252.1 LysR family transcriptional regulator [Metabacillus litoralis]QNF28765.1 LysR family transcriptional regulator [Metabacillus sp. KUDC1714]